MIREHGRILGSDGNVVAAYMKGAWYSPSGKAGEWDVCSDSLQKRYSAMPTTRPAVDMSWKIKLIDGLKIVTSWKHP